MALIIKSSDIKKSKEKQRQIYTWAACAFVGLFVLSVAVPMMSGGGKSANDGKYKDRYYDLAALPFNSDIDEQELLASSRYQDIGKADLISTLFSKREKEERQIEDEVLGVPPPPDEDYQQAATQREAVANKAERTAQRSASRPGTPPAKPTAAGTMKGSNTVSGGGSSGVRTNIWEGTPDNKNKGKDGANAAAGNANAKQTAEDLKKGGRGIGFMDAYAKSDDAAKQEDLLAAAGGAASAFDGSAEEAALDTDLEDAMAGLGDLNAGDTSTPPNLADLLNKAKEKAKKENKKPDPKAGPDCNSLFGNGWAHALNCIGSTILNKGLDALLSPSTWQGMGKGNFGYSDKEWNLMSPYQKQQIINNQTIPNNSAWLQKCMDQPLPRPPGCPQW